MSTLFHHSAQLLSPLRRLMTSRVFKATLPLGALLSVSLFAAPDYYVSGQQGNDSWSGTLPSPNSAQTDGPFRTVARAQAGMQSSSIKTAHLRAGSYSIASTLQLYAADSGETWVAYPGESPILDGGGAGRVILNNINNVTLQGLTLQNMGAGGLYLNGGNVISLRQNNFYNCNGDCIFGNSVTNSIIDSNTINGQSPGNQFGIGNAYQAIQLTYGSSNNQVTHNLIENCQGGGIGFDSGPTDPPNSNNIVDRNILQNVDSNVVDMGAIYMYDPAHSAVGNQITNNIVNGNLGSGALTKAFYLDEGTSNVLVSGNICRDCGTFAWQIHVGDHNTIVNNIFYLSPGAQVGLYQTNVLGADWGMTGNVFERNIIYFSGSVPPSLYQVNVVPHDALPADQNNLYYSATNAYIPNGQFMVDASPVYANPEFAQPSTGNFSLPASSPAYSAIGFQPLASDQGPVNGAPASGVPAGGAPAGGAPAGGGSVSGGTGGSLTGTANSSNTPVDLTAEGPTDWAHWGTTSLTRKNGVTPQISAWSIVGSGPAMYYNNDPRAVTFFDGTAPTTGEVNDGIFVNGQNGFSFTAPAGTSAHTLAVHVGGYLSGGTLTAHLSDGSAADFVDSTAVVNGPYDRNYTLTYQAASAGQTLMVTWVLNSGTGNVTLDGAALQ